MAADRIELDSALANLIENEGGKRIRSLPAMIACEFSEAIPAVNAQLSDQFLAHVSGTRLTIRDADALEVIGVHACVEKPDKILFSPDGMYVVCVLLAKGCTQCFSMSDRDWKCRIQEGAAGLIDVAWYPDSRGLIAISDFGVQMALYSLTDGTSSIITSPKQGLGQAGYSSSSSATAQQQLLSFSDCSRFLCVVHRIELQDYIGVYSATPVSELAKFKCRGNNNDVTAVNWTPNGAHIVAIDSPLTYRLAVYTPSGEVVATYEAYQNALGIRSISFFRPAMGITASSSSESRSSAQLLAVNSYDGKIRLLSTRSWQAVFVLPLVHPREMDVGLCADGQTILVETMDGVSSVEGLVLIVDEEPPAPAAGKSRRPSTTATDRTLYVTRRAAAIKSLPRVQPDPRSSKLLPPLQGVSWMGRSACGEYLAARESSMQRCLWVWNPLEGKLIDLIVQIDPILSAQWRPGGDGGVGESDEISQPPAVAMRALHYDGKYEEKAADEQGAVPSLLPPPPPPPLSSSSSRNPPLLAFCTGSSRVYFWMPGAEGGSGNSHRRGVQWVDLTNPLTNASFVSTTTAGTNATTMVPTSMLVTSLQWSRNGRRLLLKGRDSCQTCEVEIAGE